MAKVFYENKFLLTRNLHKEYCKNTYDKMRKKIKITNLILGIVFLAATVLLVIFTRLAFIATLTLLFSIYFFVMIQNGYRFSEWINYKKICEETADVEGGEVLNIIRFEPVQIHVRAGITGYSFKYESIERAFETDRLIILILKRPGMIEHSQLVFKGGFSEKNDDTLIEFKKFINEKVGKNILVV